MFQKLSEKIYIILFILFILKLNLIQSIYSLNARERNEVNSYLRNVARVGLHDYLHQTVVGNPQIYSEYDFIIIGAGPAGCVLANRLSENSKQLILLIEAGGTENFFHQIPAMSAYFQSTASNWGYQSVSQKNACFGMPNNKCSLPRGKILGGSSSINYMIYNRGNKRDFDNWSELGNPGWSYSEILPYFKKSERAYLKNGIENVGYHNYTGNLNVEYASFRTQMVHAYVKANKQAGYREVDYNGESQLGVSYVQTNTHAGQRASAAKTFINPIKNRKNLHILNFSKVTRVLIDPNSKSVTGVEFINNKKRFAIKVRKEVIISSGTFNSPQILMLSGIGPADNLKAIGIPVIKELPVGKIMYDHMSHFGPTFLLNTTGNTIKTQDLTTQNIEDYLSSRPSQLSIIGGVEALTFLKIPNSTKPADVPDVELIFVAGSFASDEGTGLLRGANIKKSIYNKMWKPLEFDRRDHCSILVMDFHPKSKGRVWLHNRDPFEPPRIDPKYFSKSEDIEHLLHGIKEAIRIFEMPAFQQIGAKILDTPLPGCENYKFGTDDYWRCSIKTLSYTLHHQVATCKMGPENDKTTVVNYQLKVHGIKGLRIADNSIIPVTPTAHTNAMSFMVGEKAADMIKFEWKI